MKHLQLQGPGDMKNVYQSTRKTAARVRMLTLADEQSDLINFMCFHMNVYKRMGCYKDGKLGHSRGGEGQGINLRIQ